MLRADQKTSILMVPYTARNPEIEGPYRGSDGELFSKSNNLLRFQTTYLTCWYFQLSQLPVH